MLQRIFLRWASRLGLGLVLVGGLLLVITPPTGAKFNPFQITMESGFPYYEPLTLTVGSHQPIRWVNPTASPHTIRHDGCLSGHVCAFDSGAVPPNGKFEIPGLPPGRYPYHCQIHPIMRGELKVVGSADAGVGPDGHT